MIATTQEPSARQPERAAERGSAYLFVLFVLLVLTVVGLSLALITQTEVQIGASEQQLTRVFYGADSGLRIQLANHLVNGAVVARTRAQNNEIELGRRTILGTAVREIIEVSPIYPIFSGTCNLCMLNQDAEYFSVNHVVTSTSTRLSVGATPLEQARKTVSQMFALQPWDQTIAALQEAGDLSIIKY